MHKTLVILAAGIGSRFGGGIKQLTPIDHGGHLIIDYSIHDAIAAGFDKIVFIIRHDIAADFKAVIGDRIEEVCKPLGVEIGGYPISHRLCCGLISQCYVDMDRD